MTTIVPGQVYTNKHTNTQVTVQEVTEYALILVTPTGFIYRYSYAQFLKEYVSCLS